jgi:hypothetical protein
MSVFWCSKLTDGTDVLTIVSQKFSGKRQANKVRDQVVADAEDGSYLMLVEVLEMGHVEVKRAFVPMVKTKVAKVVTPEQQQAAMDIVGETQERRVEVDEDMTLRYYEGDQGYKVMCSSPSNAQIMADKLQGLIDAGESAVDVTKMMLPL